MLSTWRKTIDRKQAESGVLQSQLITLEKNKEKLEKLQTVRNTAKMVFDTAAGMTQKTVEIKLGSIVTMALAAVFEEDPYTFKMEFIPRRGVMECDLYFELDGEQLDPMSEAEFGASDIASFASKISFRNAGNTRPILIMDEPFKNLSRSYHELTATMMREICKKLKVQLIVITHIPELKEGANATMVTIKDSKRISHIIPYTEEL